MCVSKPKIPTPTPVIERQAYKNPVSRASLASDSSARQRMIAGVATSAQGVTGAASTTRKVTGGDQQIMPVLSGASPSPVIPVVDTPVVGPQAQPQTPAGAPKKNRGLLGFSIIDRARNAA